MQLLNYFFKGGDREEETENDERQQIICEVTLAKDLRFLLKQCAIHTTLTLLRWWMSEDTESPQKEKFQGCTEVEEFQRQKQTLQLQ